MMHTILVICKSHHAWLDKLPQRIHDVRQASTWPDKWCCQWIGMILPTGILAHLDCRYLRWM